MSKPRITITLDNDVAGIINRIAKHKGVTKSEIIGHMVRHATTGKSPRLIGNPFDWTEEHYRRMAAYYPIEHHLWKFPSKEEMEAHDPPGE